MFSGRIEIQSPGALPNNLAVDDLPHRQATRNELLTSLLGRVSAAGIKGAGGRLFIIERRGDGVPIMRRETRELSGKLPEFRLIAGSELCVSIPAASLEFLVRPAPAAGRRNRTCAATDADAAPPSPAASGAVAGWWPGMI